MNGYIFVRSKNKNSVSACRAVADIIPKNFISDPTAITVIISMDTAS